MGRSARLTASGHHNETVPCIRVMLINEGSEAGSLHYLVTTQVGKKLEAQVMRDLTLDRKPSALRVSANAVVGQVSDRLKPLSQDGLYCGSLVPSEAPLHYMSVFLQGINIAAYVRDADRGAKTLVGRSHLRGSRPSSLISEFKEGHSFAHGFISRCSMMCADVTWRRRGHTRGR